MDKSPKKPLGEAKTKDNVVVLRKMRRGLYMESSTSLRRIIWVNFAAGLSNGFGFTLGTLLVLLLLSAVVISFASKMPFIGDELVKFLQMLREAKSVG